MQSFFITGTGTDVGKTVVAAIMAEALGAHYWKPVQAGYANGTDAEWVKSMLSNPDGIHPEVYRLKLAASPHIAAREENTRISTDNIKEAFQQIQRSLPDKETPLIIEGAGGLMVPINEKEFMADLAKQLPAKLILVSRNYLGSINHSLLTAEACKQYKLDVAGWIFNDRYMAYEEEIAQWSGFPRIAGIPHTANIDAQFIREQAALVREGLKKIV
jgi:dethiobiotin synthetase